MQLYFDKVSPYYKLELLALDFSEDDYNALKRRGNIEKSLTLSRDPAKGVHPMDTLLESESDSLIVSLPNSLESKVSSIQVKDSIDKYSTSDLKGMTTVADEATIKFDCISPDEYDSLFLNEGLVYRIHLGYVGIPDALAIFSESNATTNLVFQGRVVSVEISYEEQGISVTLNLISLEAMALKVGVDSSEIEKDMNKYNTYFEFLTAVSHYAGTRLLIVYPTDPVAASSLYTMLMLQWGGNKPWTNALQKYDMSSKAVRENNIEKLLIWFSETTGCYYYVKNGVMGIGIPGAELDTKISSKIFKYGLLKEDRLTSHLLADEMFRYDVYSGVTFSEESVDKGSGSSSTPRPDKPENKKTKKVNEATMEQSDAYIDLQSPEIDGTIDEIALSAAAEKSRELLRKKKAIQVSIQAEKNKSEKKKKEEKQGNEKNPKFTPDKISENKNAGLKSKKGKETASKLREHNQEVKKASIEIKRAVCSVNGLLGDPFLRCRELFSLKGFLSKHNKAYSIDEVEHNFSSNEGYTMNIRGYTDIDPKKPEKKEREDKNTPDEINRRRLIIGGFNTYIDTGDATMSGATNDAGERNYAEGIRKAIKIKEQEEADYMINNNVIGVGLTGDATRSGVSKPNPSKSKGKK